MFRLPLKFVAPLVAVAVVGGLALVDRPSSQPQGRRRRVRLRRTTAPPWRRGRHSRLTSAPPCLFSKPTSVPFRTWRSGIHHRYEFGTRCRRYDASPKLPGSSPTRRRLATGRLRDYLSVNQTLATAMADAGHATTRRQHAYWPANASLTKLAADTQRPCADRPVLAPRRRPDTDARPRPTTGSRISLRTYRLSRAPRLARNVSAEILATTVGIHPVMGEAQRVGEASSGYRLRPADSQTDGEPRVSNHMSTRIALVRRS